MSTIFDNVVTSENNHTELLCNMMKRSPQMAGTSLSCFMEQKISEEDAAKFIYDTQHPFMGPDGRQIPDLKVLGENLQCLVELKIDPGLGLTPKQLDGYASCFSIEKEDKHLCFLVPNDWKHSRVIAQISNTLEGQRIHVHRCYWQDLIPKLSERVATIEDKLLKEVVSFWKWRFEIIQMTAEERESMKTWSGEKYRAMRKLQKTIDEAKKLFDVRQYQTESETAYVDTYGFYIMRGNKYLLWVGIWDAAPAPLSYGYRLEGPDWLKPSSIPSGGIIVSTTVPKNHRYHIWALPQETWDNAEMIYNQAASFIQNL